MIDTAVDGSGAITLNACAIIGSAIGSGIAIRNSPKGPHNTMMRVDDSKMEMGLSAAPMELDDVGIHQDEEQPEGHISQRPTQTLDEVTKACEQFAEGLVRLHTRGLSSDDERVQILQSLLNHSLARKRNIIRHFNYNFQYQLSGKAPHASKPGLLSPSQRIQLIIQMQALRKLIRRNRKNQFSFPSSIQLALSCFSNHDKTLPELSTSTSAPFNLAARLASRVADPCGYLVEIMGEQFIPRPFHPKLLLELRDRIVCQQIERRQAEIGSKRNLSVSERVETASLRLIQLQKKVRRQVNEQVPWSVIESGKYKTEEDEEKVEEE